MRVRTSLFALAIATAMLATAPRALAETVSLKQDIVAAGPLVLLGDVLDGAGAAGARPIGPAPRSGATATFLPHMVERAARAAGLDWTPPADLRVITVRGTGGHRVDHASAQAGAVIRKGDLVVLTYNAPGVRVTARTRAQSDGAPGQSVRLTNLTSNRAIDAIVVGPGRASANLDHPITE